MRIGLAADTYKPYISGVTNYISLHKAEFERQGHDVHVITFGPRTMTSDEPGVIYSPGFQLKMGYSFGLKYSPHALEVIRQMDIIHLHHPFISGNLILRASKDYNLPIVFTGHTRYDHLLGDYLPWFPKKAGLGILKMYLPGFCRKMKRVICNSAASVEGLRNCGVDMPLEVIPNGINLKPFQAVKKKPDLRAQLAGFGKIIFLYVGRLAVEKNLPTLMEAFASLCELHIPVQLVLVGKGPISEQLKRDAERLGIRDQVTFTGLVDYADLPDYYACSDVFVMPSVNDTHPLTVLEAMGTGLPLVVVRSPAYEDTALDGENGLVVNNSQQALAEAMETLAVDEELRQRMGQRSREIAEKFSVENTAGQLLQLYQTVISENARR
jgi:1,2-diacylglycerol 3-alpha-glucosyltransferase